MPLVCSEISILQSLAAPTDALHAPIEVVSETSVGVKPLVEDLVRPTGNVVGCLAHRLSIRKIRQRQGYARIGRVEDHGDGTKEVTKRRGLGKMRREHCVADVSRRFLAEDEVDHGVSQDTGLPLAQKMQLVCVGRGVVGVRFPYVLSLSSSKPLLTESSENVAEPPAGTRLEISNSTIVPRLDAS